VQRRRRGVQPRQRSQPGLQRSEVGARQTLADGRMSLRAVWLRPLEVRLSQQQSLLSLRALRLRPPLGGPSHRADGAAAGGRVAVAHSSRPRPPLRHHRLRRNRLHAGRLHAGRLPRLRLRQPGLLGPVALGRRTARHRGSLTRPIPTRQVRQSRQLAHRIPVCAVTVVDRPALSRRSMICSVPPGPQTIGQPRIARLRSSPGLMPGISLTALGPGSLARPGHRQRVRSRQVRRGRRRASRTAACTAGGRMRLGPQTLRTARRPSAGRWTSIRDGSGPPTKTWPRRCRLRLDPHAS
jgi:hypothetical protein